MCKSDHEAEIIKRDYHDIAYATQPAPEIETFKCWRCEEDTPEDEKYPMGLEWVCEGCDERY